jgi:hypothetical protein
MTLAILMLAIAPAVPEGDAQATTSLADEHGRTLAGGHYRQWMQNGLLHMEARYDFPDGRTAVERASLRLWPQIEQQDWDWVERDGAGNVIRAYQVDMRTRTAVTVRVDQGKRWRKEVPVEPGTTFAGIGFITVIKALREMLGPGQRRELKAIAFMPEPRSATVSVIHEGTEKVHLGWQTVRAERFAIHPEIGIARYFVHVSDEHLWLFTDGAPDFVRYEGPLVEPADPTIHIDLVPGPSARAEPRPPRPTHR